VFLTFYPKKRIIELKSLKQYVYALRNITVSYERLINVFYDHVMEVYEPERIRVIMVFNPRGGISSKLTIDSDWKVRGGDEKFNDWKGNIEDQWSVTL
jgi:7-cyano-7-deazaguanine reductase